MMKCGECGKDVVTIDDVRGCQMCHRNGTAAMIHCEHAGSDPIESEKSSLPFSAVEVSAPEEPETEAAPELAPEPAKKSRKNKRRA